jgi:hypothetical protein
MPICCEALGQDSCGPQAALVTRYAAGVALTLELPHTGTLDDSDRNDLKAQHVAIVVAG